MTVNSGRIPSSFDQTSDDQTDVERQVPPSRLDQIPEIGECTEYKTDDTDYTEGEGGDVAV